MNTGKRVCPWPPANPIMRADELHEFLRATPFAPFRLHINSGQHVDVMHPETALVARSLVAVGVVGGDGQVDHLVHYNLIHIVKFEPLDGKPVSTKSPS